MTDAATPADRIWLRSERRRRFLAAILIIAAVVLISVTLVALAGQAFGPDPMTGT